MALGPEYCKQIYEELRRHANFPLNRPIALGDYGVLKDGIFERLGNIGQLGIRFQTVTGTGQSTFQYKSKGNVDFALTAKGDIQPGGVPAVRAGIELKFSSENAVFFVASGCRATAIDNLRAVEAALIRLLDQGQWETGFYVVTEVNQASKTTAIASADRTCEVKLEVDSPAIEAIHLGDASLTLHVKRSRNTSLEIVTESEQVPLMQLARLRGLFQPSLNIEAAASPRFQLSPDDASAAATSAPAAIMEIITPAGDAADKAAFLESLGATQADFELGRAINAYIPILRACYAYFSTGDPNQAMPSGYERVANIRARHEEAVEGLESLTPEAISSLQNDLRALGQADPGLESTNDPDAFGFVVREIATGSIIVSIRGTQTPEEWVKNFTAIPVPFSAVPGFGTVHLGFEKMWMRIRGDVMDALGNLPAGTRITFLGHSLGGAMATLGTVDVKKNFNRPLVDLATVGCPRVGEILFHRHFDHLIAQAFRVAEIRDIVPHVPPAFLVWLHVGLHIPVRSHVTQPHSLDSYLEGLRGLGGGLMESVGDTRVFATRMS